MRAFIIATGVLTILLGIAGFVLAKDSMMLQGGLTLGGGWIICALFSLGEGSKWHGYVGAGVLGLLGGARCIPTLLKLPSSPGDTQVQFQSIAAGICLVMCVVVVRALLAERTRKQIEALKAGD